MKLNKVNGMVLNAQKATWLTLRDLISAFSPVLKVSFGAFAAISLTPSYLERKSKRNHYNKHKLVYFNSKLVPLRHGLIL